MQKRIILLISLLISLSILSMAKELKENKIESMTIKSLIEKAKTVPKEERKKIENLIKKKIAQAHRENSHKG